MKRLLSLVAFFATLQASAQQVNPVPDYVFRNQMSVGRGTVTDTAAYFSIGPRYGANKGFMPPIVGDTATFSSGKRNGLLIFSVQKNKFLYWDSVRVQWSDMAGSSGSYIVAGDTATMLTPYVRHAGYGLTKSGQSFLVDTLNISTRAWRQKGIDSVVSIIPAAGVGGSGTTNYVPKFTASTTIGNSQIFDEGTNVGIGTTSPGSKLDVRSTGYNIIRSTGGNGGYFDSYNTSGTRLASFGAESGGDVYFGSRGSSPVIAITNSTERLRIFANGRVFVGASPSDAGYQFDVNGTGRFQGTLYTRSGTAVGIEMATTSAIRNSGTQYFDYGTGGSGDFYFRGGSGFANVLTLMNGGNVGIGTASPTTKLHIEDGTSAIKMNSTGANASAGNLQYSVGGTLKWNLTSVATSNDFGFYNNGGTNAFDFYIKYATGNVGIGTASPLNKLHVEFSDATAYSPSNTLTAAPIAYFYNNTSADAAVATTIRLDAGNLTGNNAVSLSAVRTGNADAAMTFGTRSGGGSVTERARITSSGELLINTTTDAGDYKLQVAGNIYGSSGANLAMTSGNVGIGLVPAGQSGFKTLEIGGSGVSGLIDVYQGTSRQLRIYNSSIDSYLANNANGGWLIFRTTTSGGTQSNSLSITDASELLVNTSTDVGDYKLQVVGNARIGTGKLDIASNTTFGLGIARSGTSEIAGQIYNSNGILYTGVESSAGGQIFTGSSAYAAVIGSGANYPLQFATNNVTRATIDTGGELLINTLSDQGDYKLQVNGSVYNTGQVTRGVINAQGTGAQVFVDSTSNLSSFAGIQTLSGSNTAAFLSGNVTWNTTGNANAIDIFVTNTASGANANFMQLGDGTNNFKVTKDASIITANPTGGTARKWRLGSAATVSPTSPNRTIQIEVDGVIYYLHAKTTND